MRCARSSRRERLASRQARQQEVVVRRAASEHRTQRTAGGVYTLSAQAKLRGNAVERTVQTRPRRAERFLPQRFLFFGARLVDSKAQARALERRQLTPGDEEHRADALGKYHRRVGQITLTALHEQRGAEQRRFALPQSRERVELGAVGRQVFGAEALQLETQMGRGFGGNVALPIFVVAVQQNNRKLFRRRAQ